MNGLDTAGTPQGRQDKKPFWGMKGSGRDGVLWQVNDMGLSAKDGAIK
jgi:hypothetical protein